MKLLLVDDDVFLRDMYATKFKENKDEVVTAASGTEALQILKDKGGVDVVVVDMIMPGITGAPLIEAIVATGHPCIVLSNQSESSDIEGAKAAGAIGYIIKADNMPSTVVEKVHTLMSTN